MTSPQLDQTLAPVLAGTRMLVFDMNLLDYISSACMRNIQPQIRKVFDIVKDLPDVSIYKDDGEMDQYLAAMQKKIIGGEE